MGRLRRTLVALSVAALIGCSDASVSENPVLLYVANTGSDDLSVIDHATREVIATIPVGGIPHGQIPSHTGDRLYATTEDTGQVLAIDTRTQEILWRVQGTEGEVDELHQPCISLDDETLFVPDLLKARLLRVDTRAARIDGEVEIVDRTDPDAPVPLVALHNSYLSADGRSVYVEGILSQRVAKIDVATSRVTRTYLLDGDPRPLAILRDESKMYAQLTDLEGFVEIDLATGEELRRIEWNNPPTDSWERTDARLKPKSHGIALTPDETELWAASTLADKWYVYAVPSLDLLAIIDVPEGNAPNWIGFTDDGVYAYASNTTFVPDENGEPRTDVPGTVTVIDTATREVVDTIEVGALPKRIHAVRVPG